MFRAGVDNRPGMASLSLVLALFCVVPQDVGVDWRKDYETARAEAREQKRLLLLHFYLPGRPLCKTMDEETFAHPDVARVARETFVAVRVDIDARPELFEATIGGRGGLATCVLDLDGDVVSALHGFAAPPAFLAFLERAEKGCATLRTARAEAEGKSPVKLHALAEVYRKLESLRRAEACYRSVIDLAAGPVEVVASCHERMARLRVLRGRNLEARKHLEEHRQLDPGAKFPWADRILLTEALALAIERKHADAARVLQESLAKHPDSEEADHRLYALGFVLHQDGKDKPAMEAFDRALREHPKSSWIPAILEQMEHIRNPQPDHQH